MINYYNASILLGTTKDLSFSYKQDTFFYKIYADITYSWLKLTNFHWIIKCCKIRIIWDSSYFEREYSN